jgi:hypothetical protein
MLTLLLAYVWRKKSGGLVRRMAAERGGADHVA